MKKLVPTFLNLILLATVILPAGIASAQETTPNGPVYIVQEGDSLWDIAARFHLSMEALANANGITNANQISIGQELVIPGLEGIQGVLTTQTVPYGESIQSLSRRYNLSQELLKRLNHITSPGELFAGYSLIIPQADNNQPSMKRIVLGAGQSLLELAVLNGTSPWSLMEANGKANSWSELPGEVLQSPGQDEGGPGALPSNVSNVSVPKLVQGKTADIQLDGEDNLTLSGKLGEYKLNFFKDGTNQYTALQGIHAMAEPGLYPMTLQVESPDGVKTNFSQMVLVNAGDFLYDRSLAVDPATLDPETNKQENDLWMTSAAGVTPEKFWNNGFLIPVDPVFANCYSSRFGNRRSYNGGEYKYFHTGLDFCGQVGDPIYAAAPGRVVFTGPLTVRGNATMIDHGEGVYSAYMHQSEILVNEGDYVEAGQLIGRVGNTGRVEGPHLHFEVLVGDVQVDPIAWLNGDFP